MAIVVVVVIQLFCCLDCRARVGPALGFHVAVVSGNQQSPDIVVDMIYSASADFSLVSRLSSFSASRPRRGSACTARACVNLVGSYIQLANILCVCAALEFALAPGFAPD